MRIHRQPVFRPHRSGVDLGLILVALLFASGCSGGAPEADRNLPPTTVATEGSVEEVLEQIVLAETEPPTGTEFSNETRGAEVAAFPVFGSAPEVQATVQQKVVDGLSRDFIHPELAEAAEDGDLDGFVKNFKSSGYLAMASGAIKYQDEASAQAAFDVFLEHISDQRGLKPAGEARLGDEGMIFEGRLTDFMGIPRRLHIWRTGALVLILSADGSIEVDAELIRAIAEAMQARAVP